MSREEEFWKWFAKNQESLLHFERDQERIFDRLSKQLHKVDPDLCFEFGPPQEQREFIVSAGGTKRAFPAVVALFNAVPPLAHWKVVAFRPRRQLFFVVEFRNVRVDPREVKFSLLDNGKMAGIYLFIPGLLKSDLDFKQVGYLMLDDVLGEYDVETRLGLIEMFAPDHATVGDRYQLVELPTLFDQLVARLEGRSGKAS